MAFAQTRATNDGKDGGCLQRRDKTTTAAREVPETKPKATRAPAVTGVPGTLATKKKKRRTVATKSSRKMTFAQFQQYEVFLK